MLGVAWDPQEEYLLTVSSDRSVRFHSSASCKWKNDSRSMHVATRMEFPTKGSGPPPPALSPPVPLLFAALRAGARSRNLRVSLLDFVAGAEKVGQLSCVRPVSALAETDVEKVRPPPAALPRLPAPPALQLVTGGG